MRNPRYGGRTMRVLAVFFAVLFCAAVLPVPAAQAQQARPGERADFVLIDKSERKLWLYQDGKVIRAYSGLQYGDAPVGHKQFEGDERTPEGRYTISYGNEQSSYYLSLYIDYPNAQDRAFANARGRSPGGLIFIHGQPNGLPFDARVPGDWTDGCIAMSNAEIAEVWSLVPDGTPIEIRP